MTLQVLERKRKDVLKSAKVLRDEIGDSDPNEQQETKLTEIRSELEAIDKRIDTEKLFERADEQDKIDADKEKSKATNSRDDWTELRSQFSIARAIAGIYCRLQGSSKVDDAKEVEISQEITTRNNKRYDGMAFPLEAVINLEQRAISTTTPGAGPGGRIVATDYRPQDYIALPRDALVTQRLGIRTLRGLQGNVSIPKARSAASMGWATESGDLAVSDMTFETPISMTPHKTGALGQYSGQMLLQGDPSIDALIRDDLAAAMARNIDSVILEGGGTNEPDGVIATIARTARRSSDPANGVALAASEVYDLMQAVDVANIGETMRSFLMGFEIKYHALQQVLFANTDRTWYQNGQLLGSPAIVSNIAPTATRGSLASAPTLIYANWSDMIAGFWSDGEILVNPYGTGYTSGGVQVRILTYCDIAFRYNAAFGYLDGIIV